MGNKKSSEELNSKSLIRFAKVVQIEDNLETASGNEISRNSFGRRIKVKLIEDDQNLNNNDLPWVWPLLPKHLQIIPKVGEMVMIFLQTMDGAKGNRFYIGPIISQDYYLDKCGEYEALSLLQGVSTKPLCHPRGNSLNDGTYPSADTIAIQGRGDAAIWLKDEEMRLMCGHKPSWSQRSNVEKADPGSLTFNKENLSYIQLKYGRFKENNGSAKADVGKEFNSVVNVVADRINLISHSGVNKLSNVKVNDPNELVDTTSVQNIATDAQSVVYGEQLVAFLNRFRTVFGEHTHHWLNDKQVVVSKDADFWNLNLEEELLCKAIKIV